MECDKIKQLITDYIENKLNEAEIKWINLHIKECPVCREYYESQKKIDSVLKKVLGSASEKKYSICDAEKFNDALKLKINIKNDKIRNLKRERKNYFLRFENIYKYAAMVIILAGIIVAVYNETGKDGLDLKSKQDIKLEWSKDIPASENLKLEEKFISAAPQSSINDEKEYTAKKNEPEKNESFELALNERIDKVSKPKEIFLKTDELKKREKDKTLFTPTQLLNETDKYSKTKNYRDENDFKIDVAQSVKSSEKNIGTFALEESLEIQSQSDIKLISENNKEVSDMAYDFAPQKKSKKLKQKNEISESKSFLTFSGKGAELKYNSIADTSVNVSRIRSLSFKDERDSNFINVFKQKIIELYKNKKYKEAVNLFEKNQKLFNNDTEILNITAESYLKIEKENFAIQNYQRSLDIDKSQIYIQNIMKQNTMRNKD